VGLRPEFGIAAQYKRCGNEISGLEQNIGFGSRPGDIRFYWTLFGATSDGV